VTTLPRDIRRMLRGIALLTMLSAAFSGQSFAKPINSDQFTVTDGDTIHVRGERNGTRLVGFNAPETNVAHCSKELEVGSRATKHLRELVATSDMDLEKVPCACKPGTEGTNKCNYGRS
jgi:micrococcal nuclease